jgi:hypothetical protein
MRVRQGIANYVGLAAPVVAERCVDVGADGGSYGEAYL